MSHVVKNSKEVERSPRTGGGAGIHADEPVAPKRGGVSVAVGVGAFLVSMVTRRVLPVLEIQCMCVCEYVRNCISTDGATSTGEQKIAIEMRDFSITLSTPP